LFVSISKLEDMIERQRISFQHFLEAKPLRHQAKWRKWLINSGRESEWLVFSDNVGNH